MALDAFGHSTVQSEKRPIGVISVVKTIRFPDAGLMTLVASIAQAAQVQRVGVTANSTLCRGSAILIVNVAIDALYVFVSRYKRPRTVHPVVFLHRCRIDLYRSWVLVTLQAGLHQLAIAHHLLPLGLVCVFAIVHVPVLVTAHACHPLSRGIAEILEVVGLSAFVTGPAFGPFVLAMQSKGGLLSMVKTTRLPRRFGVTELTLGRFSEFLESVSVRIVIGVTASAGRARCPSRKFFGVTLVAGELPVSAGQVKLSPLLVIELVDFERPILRRVAPITRFAIKEHTLMGRTMAA